MGSCTKSLHCVQRQVNRLPRDHERFRLARDFILHALVTLQIIIETVQPRKEKFIYFSQIGVREKKTEKKYETLSHSPTRASATTCGIISHFILRGTGPYIRPHGTSP